MLLCELNKAVKDIVGSATSEQITEARDWASDCEQLSRGEKLPIPYAIGYVIRHYPGGWSAFIADCIPVQL